MKRICPGSAWLRIVAILGVLFGVSVTAGAAGAPVRIAAIGGFDSFNPFILRGTAPAGIYGLWLPLMRQSDYRAGVLLPAIATGMTVGADGRTVVFDLDPQARFSDGAPVTSADVIWTFRTLVAKGQPFFRSYYRAITGITAGQKHRVMFHLAADAPPSTAEDIATEPILPEAFWKGKQFDALLTTPPPGSGPYRIAAFHMGASVAYARIPNWWGDHLPGQQARDAIQRITYVYFGDRAVALQAFRAGELDLWRVDRPREAAELARLPGVRVASFPIDLPAGMHGFAFNLRRKMLDRPALRHGLALMFDFPWMNRVLFDDAYRRNESFFANSALAATRDVPSLPAGGADGIDDSTRERAVALIEQAGYHLDHGVMVDADGRPLRLNVLIDDAGLEVPLIAYRAALEGIGIHLDIRMLDPSAYQARIEARDYDLVYVDIPQPKHPGAAEADYFGCAAASRAGSDNLVGLCSKEVDRLINALAVAPDEASRIKAAHALDRALRGLWIVIPGWYRDQVRIAYRAPLIPSVRPPRDGFDLALWRTR